MAVRVPVVAIDRILDSATGRVKWFVKAEIDNFNDNTPEIRAGDLKPICIPGTPVLTRMTVRWDSTSAGAGLAMECIVHGVAFSTFIGTMTSTAAIRDYAQWTCFVPMSEISTANPALQQIYFSFGGPGGGHALDDLDLAMEFETYPQLTDLPLPAPQPVSLEGYRWPLKRTL